MLSVVRWRILRCWRVMTNRITVLSDESQSFPSLPFRICIIHRHCSFPLFLFIPPFHETFHGFGILYKDYSLFCILHNPVPCRADGLLGDAHDATHILIFHAHFVEDEEEGVLCWQCNQRSSGGRINIKNSKLKLRIILHAPSFYSKLVGLPLVHLLDDILDLRHIAA